METKKSIYKISFILSIMILICVFPIVCFAENNSTILLGKEYPIPDELDFRIEEHCSGHPYFLQATARPDGAFAVCSHYHDVHHHSEDTFKKKFIDIYDPSGKFLEEISFYTTSEFNIDLKDDSLNMYFYSYALVYDFDTKEIHRYEIQPGVMINSKLQEEQRTGEFHSGEWTYHSNTCFEGFISLSRSNGIEEQILVKMEGVSTIFRSDFLLSITLGIVVCIVFPGVTALSIIYARKK